jgi:predicted RNA methylase
LICDKIFKTPIIIIKKNQIMQSSVNQNHLQHSEKINLGAFYTPLKYVQIVWNLIEPFLNQNSVIFDSSCGYGNFFINNTKNYSLKANDIDATASKIAKNNFSHLEIFNKNALYNVSREQFNINKNQHLVIIGNPPYNDTTSIIKNHLKQHNLPIDNVIKTRDYGISFLLSYAKLNADIICVLHPLSYLIKKSNFNLLKDFTNNYQLIDGIVIDSSTFKETSKSISFPIIIGLYLKNKNGMNYDYIKNFTFKTFNNKSFTLQKFDFISNYITKYPLKNSSPNKDDILFWTMRDINALKRNKTFVKNFCYNTIIVDKKKLEYYIYVDFLSIF